MSPARLWLLVIVLAGGLAWAGCASTGQMAESPVCPPAQCCANGIPVACWDSLACYGYHPTKWRRWPTECEPDSTMVCPVAVPPELPETEAVPPPPPTPAPPPAPPAAAPGGQISPPMPAEQSPPPPKEPPAAPTDQPPGLIEEPAKKPLPGSVPNPEPSPTEGAQSEPPHAPLPPMPLGSQSISKESVFSASDGLAVNNYPQRTAEEKQFLPLEPDAPLPPSRTDADHNEPTMSIKLLSFSSNSAELPPAPLPDQLLR